MKKSQKILIVDDDFDTIQLVEKLLGAQGYQVRSCQKSAAALTSYKKFKPDVVLLDINMPEQSGFDIIKDLRKENRQSLVIFLTGQNETHDIVKGLDSGASDYICKPFVPIELLARVRTQLRLKKLQDELFKANRKLQDLVEVDDLTGLYNMRTVYNKIDHEILRAKRYQLGIGLIMLDMDYFKKVNDDHDHLFGSFVLSDMGKLIKSTIRSVDFAARYGGDEFLICLTHTDAEGAKSFGERLRKKVENHEFKNGEDSMKLTISLGLAIASQGQINMDARSLARNADRALYASKEAGRNKLTTIDIGDPSFQNPKLLRSQ